MAIGKSGLIGGVIGTGLAPILMQALPEDVPGILWWVILGMGSTIGALVAYIRNRQAVIDKNKDELLAIKDQIIQIKDDHTEKIISLMTAQNSFFGKQNEINGQLMEHQETIMTFIASQADFNKVIEERLTLERILDERN